MSVSIQKPNLFTLSELNKYKTYIPSVPRGRLNLVKNKQAFHGLIILFHAPCRKEPLLFNSLCWFNGLYPFLLLY